MKSALWGYLLILLGVIIIIVMFIVYSFASTSETDYYLLKETTEAALLDAVKEDEYINSDLNSAFSIPYLAIDEEKFITSFLRRFADINNYSKTYTINFYKVNGNPPYVCVELKTSSGKFTIASDSADVPIVTRINGILDLKQKVGSGDTGEDAEVNVEEGE